MKRKKNQQQHTIRIISGEFRHRQINVINAKNLRPTPARIKETLFNWLTPLIIGKTCLDLFAGSGSLGIESLSRGAKHTTFVEKNPEIVKQLRENCEIAPQNKITILQHDYQNLTKGQFDVIFLDPPYSLKILPQLLDTVKAFSPQYIYIEDERPFQEWVTERGDYEILKTKKAGSIYYGLLAPLKA